MLAVRTIAKAVVAVLADSGGSISGISGLVALGAVRFSLLNSSADFAKYYSNSANKLFAESVGTVGVVVGTLARSSKGNT